MKEACGSSSRDERLFFALWPDEEVRARLMEEARGSSGEPVPPDGYHITLAFAGEVSVSARRALEQGAAAVRAGCFVCVLDRMGALGSGVEALAPSAPAAPLLALAGDLRRLVTHVAGAPDRRPYYPHVTLARRVDDARSLRPSLPVVWAAREYVLCRSRRTRPGSYDILERWPLYEDL